MILKEYIKKYLKESLKISDIPKIDLIVDEKISPWKVYYDYCPKIKVTKPIEKAIKMVYEKDYQITNM